MKLNLSQAAEKAGISRNTLYKHIKEGRVSAQRDVNGRQSIELSELLRAYGALSGQSAQDSESKARKVHTPNATPPLEVQLAIAEERVRQLEARLLEKAEAANKLEQQYERIIESLESQVRLLEYRQHPEDQNRVKQSKDNGVADLVDDNDPRALLAKIAAKAEQTASSKAKKEFRTKRRKD